MSAEKDRLDWVSRWVRLAEEDLRNAENTLLMVDACPFTTVCFHAQQCAEKYIKALLAFRNTDFPKTHDLDMLMSLAPDVSFPLSTEETENLTGYATVSRYPGAWDPISRAEAEQAVELARRVREHARKSLPPESLHP